MRFVYSLLAAVAIMFGGIWFFSDDIVNQCGSELAAKRFAQKATSGQVAPDAEFANVQAHADGECVYIVTGNVGGSSFSAMVSFAKGSNDYQVYDLLITG
jgi:ketosteroid isomerase-like protein